MEVLFLIHNTKTGQDGGLTVEVEQVLVVRDLGHVSGGHGVRGEDWSAQVGGPQVIGAHRLLLGFTVRRERPGLFCNNNTQSQHRRTALSQTSNSSKKLPSSSRSLSSTTPMSLLSMSTQNPSRHFPARVISPLN